MTTIEVETFVNDPTDACWGLPPFPAFVTEFRDHQWQAFTEITTAFANGADVVLVDAPVGSGKTLIGEMTRRWLRRNALYVCSGLSLQDQFARDFDYAKVLKGRRNYPTADNPHLFDPGNPLAFDHVSAADCTKSSEYLPACNSCPQPQDIDEDEDDTRFPHCDNCHPVTACPYDRAKAIALSSRHACINTSYLLAEANSVGGFSRRHLVIVDECDMLEKELMGYFEVNISSRARAKYRIAMPNRKTKVAGLREDAFGDTDWGTWFEDTDRHIERLLRRFPRRLDKDQRREVQYLTRLRQRLIMVGARIEDGGWVYTGYEQGNIIFKPVKVDEFGADVLWNHADKWLLMSGTIIDPTEMVTSLGLPEDKRWEVVEVPMTFPRENRPIKILPAAEMSAKNKDVAWPAMAKRVAEIAEHHPDERILVHAVSYALTQYIVDRLPRDRTVTYSGANDRESALTRYKEIPNGIIVGPSLDRGIDLPGDLCRVQVVCKLPFPYLGDKQVSARLYGTSGGQQWYLIQCIRSFVQMTGRGVRNERDYAITYVLDKAFQNNIYKKGRRLLPSYLLEAIDWSGRI